ncbi:MAG TPA: MmcQ/YjbR family DNA-binding protein [Mycobacteriales bacterium]|nr:MmcQ/YjbR family DNA-binding protein [Mycobacteriales bacterium]
MDTPLDLPEEFEARVQEICLALPDVVTRVDESRSPERSTAYVFDVRGRPFCTLVAAVGRGGEPRTFVIVRARPDEREALLAGGAPFFAPRGTSDRLGVILCGRTDWTEVQQLVTESYRLLAPKKLSNRLEL